MNELKNQIQPIEDESFDMWDSPHVSHTAKNYMVLGIVNSRLTAKEKFTSYEQYKEFMNWILRSLKLTSPLRQRVNRACKLVNGLIGDGKNPRWAIAQGAEQLETSYEKMRETYYSWLGALTKAS